VTRIARQRVVVTGMGVISPIGTGTDVFWQALLAGRSATAEVTRFDTTKYDTHKAAEVIGAEVELQHPALETAARSTRFAATAAQMAVEDAAALSDMSPTRIGVCFGMVIGNRPLVERFCPKPGQPVSCADPEPWLDPAAVSRLPALMLGLKGPNVALPNACAAGNVAVAHATELIASGRCDGMVAGGADEVSEAMFMMFNSFHGLAPEVVAPFDANRDGMMLGEGAGALFLESADSASARGARVYGQVLGHASLCDAYHMTAPHPEGRGAIRCMRSALDMAGLRPEEVDYVSAHGTATPANDVVEAQAIRRVLGDAADSVPVSSIKGMVGHMQGAASVVEAISCLMAIRDGIVPPNANLRDLDPQCPINVVSDGPRRHSVEVALNNAFGFGGNVSCVALGAA
jgi:3-oxoacyl-[acyl-carrier-protein] synthase II